MLIYWKTLKFLPASGKDHPLLAQRSTGPGGRCWCPWAPCWSSWEPWWWAMRCEGLKLAKYRSGVRNTKLTLKWGQTIRWFKVQMFRSGSGTQSLEGLHRYVPDHWRAPELPEEIFWVQPSLRVSCGWRSSECWPGWSLVLPGQWLLLAVSMSLHSRLSLVSSSHHRLLIGWQLHRSLCLSQSAQS